MHRLYSRTTVHVSCASHCWCLDSVVPYLTLFISTLLFMQVMEILRENRDSLVATLEAFVHDPLISWRLLNTKKCVSVNMHHLTLRTATDMTPFVASGPRWPSRPLHPRT